MPDSGLLFEGLDLLDLWHLYGHIERAAKIRHVSPSKISRRVYGFLQDLDVSRGRRRGVPDLADLLDSSILLHLRLAYQHWRLQTCSLKVLPTFSTASALYGCRNLDVLSEIFLTAGQIKGHLCDRRVDLVLSSSLDLAGELIDEARHSVRSLFAAVELFSEEVTLALNPEHPLADCRELRPEDCAVFPSAAYPAGMAERAAAALSIRGLWRYPCKRLYFDPSEWLLGMRSEVGVCYMSALFQHAAPETRQLRLAPFAESLRQTTAVVVLKEIANTPAVVQTIGLIRQAVLCALQTCHYEVSVTT